MTDSPQKAGTVAGEIIAQGKPDQVIALPQVRREYFGEANVAAA